MKTKSVKRTSTDKFTVVACVMSLAVSAYSAIIYDGVLQWAGDPMGGEWTETDNWRVVGSTSFSAEELFSKSVFWDFSTLSDGAVVSNNGASVCIAGLALTNANMGTIRLCGTKDISFPKSFGNIDVKVGSGTILEWEQNHQNLWAGDTAGNRLVFINGNSGSGTIHLNPSEAFVSYLLDVQPCASCTVIVGPKFDAQLSSFTLWNAATLKFDADATVAHLQLGEEGCKVDLQGNKLCIGSGETVLNRTYLHGQFVGTGDVVWYGGNPRTMGTLNIPLRFATGYAGTWSVYDAPLEFPASCVLPESLSFAINGGAPVIFNADTTLNGLMGFGATGGIRMNGKGTTLTLTSSNEASTTYAARISGLTDVTKQGTGYVLTLTGDNQYTGTTTVAAGTLAVKRPFFRKGLVRRWSFDDADRLWYDSAPYGVNLGTRNLSASAMPFATNGVAGGSAVYFPATSQNASFFYTPTTRPKNGWPVGAHAVSVSLWLKPDEMPSNPTYIYRHGNWGGNGRQFTLWGMDNGTKLEVCLDNWLTVDSANSPMIDTPDLMDGNWHHVVICYADNTLKMWYDGELRTTKTNTHSLDISYGTEMNIGSAEAWARYVGAVDELSIWDHALTEAEVEAEYALVRGPENLAKLLPEPVCHWAFEDPANPGKDEMRHSDLVAHPGISAQPSLVGGGTQLGAINGYAAWRDCAFHLPSSSFPETFPTGQVPFSVSVRLASSGLRPRQSILQWGHDSDEPKMFRIWNDDDPRRYRVTFGSRTVRFWGSNCNAGMRDGSFVHLVVTVDAKAGIIRMFRDGILENSIEDSPVALGDGDLYLNAGPNDAVTTWSYLDDVRIYDKALSPYEVQILSRSLATGKVGSVLPVEGPVVVNAGATLSIDCEGLAVKSVSGLGDVVLAAGSTFEADDWVGFSGSVTGRGTLLVSDKAAGPTSGSVSTAVSFADNTVALVAANSARPRVVTSGRVWLPKSGNLKLLDEGASVPQWYGKVFRIADCSGYEGPQDTTGWTFEPSDDDPRLKGRFYFSDGALYLKMKGAGTCVIIR